MGTPVLFQMNLYIWRPVHIYHRALYCLYRGHAFLSHKARGCGRQCALWDGRLYAACMQAENAENGEANKGDGFAP